MRFFLFSLICILHFKNEELRKVNIFESYNLLSKYFALNILFSLPFWYSQDEYTDDTPMSLH